MTDYMMGAHCVFGVSQVGRTSLAAEDAAAPKWLDEALMDGRRLLHDIGGGSRDTSVNRALKAAFFPLLLGEAMLV